MHIEKLLFMVGILVVNQCHGFCGGTECEFGDFGSTVPMSKNQRYDCAKNELATANKLLNALPRLSPAENKWLEGEINSGDALRKRRAFNSNEYAIRRITNDTKKFKKLLTLITVNYELGKEEEYYAWAELSHELLLETYLGYRDSLRRLLRSNIVQENDIDIKVSGQGYDEVSNICETNMRWSAIQILGKILIPKLKEK